MLVSREEGHTKQLSFRTSVGLLGADYTPAGFSSLTGLRISGHEHDPLQNDFFLSLRVMWRTAERQYIRPYPARIGLLDSGIECKHALSRKADRIMENWSCRS